MARTAHAFDLGKADGRETHPRSAGDEDRRNVSLLEGLLVQSLGNSCSFDAPKAGLGPDILVAIDVAPRRTCSHLKAGA